MLTKKEFAENIVDDFCREEGVKREDAHTRIYASSRLAVALEFLGELSEEEKEYSIQRAGAEYHKIVLNPDGSFKDAHFLTTREMLQLLPE